VLLGIPVSNTCERGGQEIQLKYCWIPRETRVRNLTNRLGFVVSLAMQVEERRARNTTAIYQRLAELEGCLNKAAQKLNSLSVPF
jgi:hypothetical protein